MVTPCTSDYLVSASVCFCSEHVVSILGLLVLAFCLRIFVLGQAQFREPIVPLVGVRSKMEPSIVSNFRFYRHAETILVEGYQTVNHPTLMF